MSKFEVVLSAAAPGGWEGVAVAVVQGPVWGAFLGTSGTNEERKMWHFGMPRK